MITINLNVTLANRVGIALVVASMLSPAAPVVAMPVHPVPEHGYRSEMSLSFSDLDRDNDGLLTRDELPPDHELARQFAQYDLDGDEALSRAEFERYLAGDDAATAAAEPEPDDDDDDGGPQ